MADCWTIVFDIEVARKIEQWPRQNRFDLLAILDLLAAEGPSGLGWDAAEAGVPSWSDLEESYRRVFWTADQARFYRLSLEVLPGSAVRMTDAAHGISRYWR
ncbi:hypothetical protein [Caulobacter sp. BK020]|uniref:hypothetical protein n=1 Tax=Caulobacter sp. BK020 TaxID=2512117 RepID=UPI00104650CA|nr:hypothetical protein [Caulobacter sp. BK020]TCS14087.1 hypothetical protein EV278_108134 [Caulobacter sp. BK020]